MPGMRWGAKFGFRQRVGCNNLVGDIRAWQAKLRDAAKPFFVSDQSRCNKCKLLGTTKSVSKTVTLPACCVGDGWPEYTFTVTVSYDASVSLLVASSTLHGVTELSINSPTVEFSVTNDNPWSFNTVTRTGYSEALNNVTAELIEEPGDWLLKAGDRVQIN